MGTRKKSPFKKVDANAQTIFLSSPTMMILSNLSLSDNIDIFQGRQEEREEENKRKEYALKEEILGRRAH